MTQSERFLQFVQRRNESDIRKAQVLARIENGELVITRRWPVARSVQLDTNVPSASLSADCKHDWLGQ